MATKQRNFSFTAEIIIGIFFMSCEASSIFGTDPIGTGAILLFMSNIVAPK